MSNSNPYPMKTKEIKNQSNKVYKPIKTLIVNMSNGLVTTREEHVNANA